MFSFSPLPTGFGHTLGNTLRRVLLTSLDGAAVTQLAINGASHQFTTVEGVQEDVVELTLNFKQLRVKSYSQNPVTLKISKKGAGPVTAADIETNAEVEVLNKDLHLATLASDKSKLEVELVVETGIGYSPSEDREVSKVGVILLDALFSPVIKAHYDVEPARLGKNVNLDNLVLTVQTDGSISPEEAVKSASTVLRDFFHKFSDGTDPEDAVVVVSDVEVEEASVLAPVSSEDVSLEELRLPTRTINALRKHGINTLHELANKSSDDLADIKNLGEKSIQEIKKLLDKEGLK